MHVPIRLTLGSVACWLVLASQCSLVLAQDDVARSTIRLTSATEPIRDHSASAETPEDTAQPIEQIRPASPIAQQDEQAYDAPSPIAAHPPAAPPLANRPRTPIRFYPNASAQTTLSQLPGPAPIQSAPRLQPNRRGGKPFQSVQSQPTISPYLYLNNGSTNANQVTNYFAFVRPQMEQVEAGRQQQREIQQLRTQLQKMSSSGGGGQQAASTQTAAHYMDTAQFYRGFQR